MTTGEKIKALRKSRGMTQEQLGQLVGVQKAAINKYETGTVVNIKKDMLQKLADALNVLPADLLDDTDLDYIIIGKDGDITVVEKKPMIESLTKKIGQLTPSNLDILDGVVDSFLRAQKDLERIGGIKEETNDD